jgi:hypothetical protein
MPGGNRAIDCKNNTFNHGIISKFVAGITIFESGMLASRQLPLKEKNNPGVPDPGRLLPRKSEIHVPTNEKTDSQILIIRGRERLK